MDPLLAVRAAIARQQPIHYDETKGEYKVLDMVFPKDATSSYLSLKGKGPAYKLEAIALFWTMHDKEYGVYYKDCKEKNIQPVSLVDRKELLAALNTPPTAAEMPSTTASGTKHSLSTSGSTEDDARSKRARLDDGSASAAATATSQLPTQKLAELRSKRVHKKTGVPGAVTSADISELQAREKDAYSMREIQRSERRLSTRRSVLRAVGFRPSMDLIEAALKRDDMRSVAVEKKPKPEEKKKATIRYDDAPPKQSDAMELGINPHGGFADAGGLRAVGSSTHPPPASSSSSASKSSRVAAPSAVGKASAKALVPDKKAPQLKGMPIIVLPSATTALLTMINVKDFLEDGSYISPADKKANGSKKEDSLVLHRVKAKGQPPVSCLVVDNPIKLPPKDWHRVVAVFASGQAWQFKGWKYTNPTDLFAHVRGFYLTYDDEKVPDSIKQWDIKVLNVSKTKRHLDPTTSLAFWQELDDYVGHRSQLQQLLNW